MDTVLELGDTSELKMALVAGGFNDIYCLMTIDRSYVADELPSVKDADKLLLKSFWQYVYHGQSSGDPILARNKLVHGNSWLLITPEAFDQYRVNHEGMDAAVLTAQRKANRTALNHKKTVASDLPTHPEHSDHPSSIVADDDSCCSQSLVDGGDVCVVNQLPACCTATAGHKATLPLPLVACITTAATKPSQPLDDGGDACLVNKLSACIAVHVDTATPLGGTVSSGCGPIAAAADSGSVHPTADVIDIDFVNVAAVTMQPTVVYDIDLAMDVTVMQHATALASLVDWEDSGATAQPSTSLVNWGDHGETAKPSTSLVNWGDSGETAQPSTSLVDWGASGGEITQEPSTTAAASTMVSPDHKLLAGSQPLVNWGATGTAVVDATLVPGTVNAAVSATVPCEDLLGPEVPPEPPPVPPEPPP